MVMSIGDYQPALGPVRLEDGRTSIPVPGKWVSGPDDSLTFWPEDDIRIPATFGVERRIFASFSTDGHARRVPIPGT